jgi:hypothetical protein
VPLRERSERQGCCLKKMVPTTVVAKARALMQQKIEAERSRVERFGHVRPPIATEAFGKRLVVVRNVIYEYDIRKYVSTFLWDFIKQTFGTGCTLAR